MRVTAQAKRLITMLVVVSCGLSAVAASAFAEVSIEPLNTKFSATTGTGQVLWRKEAGASTHFLCKEGALAGTTNSTKTNWVNVTPTFSNCEMQVGLLWDPATITSAECKTKGGISCTECKTKGELWTVTLNESKGPASTVTLHCGLLVKGPTKCEIVIPSQTVEAGLGWLNNGAETLKLEFGEGSSFKFTNVTYSNCSLEGFAEGTSIELVKTSFFAKGIHA